MGRILTPPGHLKMKGCWICSCWKTKDQLSTTEPLPPDLIVCAIVVDVLWWEGFMLKKLPLCPFNFGLTLV